MNQFFRWLFGHQRKCLACSGKGEITFQIDVDTNRWTTDVCLACGGSGSPD